MDDTLGTVLIRFSAAVSHNGLLLCIVGQSLQMGALSHASHKCQPNMFETWRGPCCHLEHTWKGSTKKPAPQCQGAARHSTLYCRIHCFTQITFLLFLKVCSSQRYILTAGLGEEEHQSLVRICWWDFYLQQISPFLNREKAKQMVMPGKCTVVPRFPASHTEVTPSSKTQLYSVQNCFLCA